METTATKLRTILLVGILSISMLSAGIGSIGAASAHSSISSVSIDDRSAVGVDPAPPADPDEWDLRSAKHSDTMTAEIVIDEETVRGISITDDVNHEGRDVSISKNALSGWIEEIPDQVSGVHEDGDRWTSEVRISGDRVIVYVPEFSTQTITFSGSVSITATPADDGSTFNYNVAPNTTISSASLQFTGDTAVDNQSAQYSDLQQGDQATLQKPVNYPSTLSVGITGQTVTNPTTIQNSKNVNFRNSVSIPVNLSGNSEPKGINGKSNPTVSVIGKELSKEKSTGFSYQSEGGTESGTIDVSDVDYIDEVDIYTQKQDDVSYAYLHFKLDGNELLAGHSPSSSGSWNTVDFNKDVSNTNSLSIYQNIDSAQTPAKVSAVRFKTGKPDSTDISYKGSPYADGSEIDLSTGKNLINVSVSGTGAVEAKVDYNETTVNNNVGLSVETDAGSQTISSSQILDEGESDDLTDQLDESLIDGQTNISINESQAPLDVNVSWQQKTKTVDPEIEISSDAGTQTVDYVGTLQDGESADLSGEVDPSLIGGNVSVSVAASQSITDGPPGQVALEYSHDAQKTRSIDYSGEEFSERYSFSRQWPHDRSSAEIVIPWASDRVVDVRSVKINGEETTSYTAEDGDLRVDLGSVQQGDQTNVSATGSKVSVTGGDISVDQPTTQGANLDSKISIDSISSSGLSIDVSESYHVTERDRMIYVPDSSAGWTAADPITRIQPGTQTVEIDPPNGSSFNLRSAAIGSEIPSGDAVIRMEDPAIPQVSVSEGVTEGDTVKLTYHDTTSGDYYRVVDELGNALDTDQAQSPAEFRVRDTSGLLRIESFTPEAAISGIQSGAAAVASDDGLGIPPWLALVATLSVSILGLAYAGTRTDIGQSMIGRRVIIGGGLLVGYIGAELVTGEALYQVAIRGVSNVLGTGISSGIDAISSIVLGTLGVGGAAGAGLIEGLGDIGFISLLLGIGLLVALYAIDQRTGIDIPRAGWGIAGGLISVWILSNIGFGLNLGGGQSLSIVIAIGTVLGLLALDQRDILSIPLPLYVGSALLVGVYVLETLAPGSVLGPLQSGLDEVGPLIWIGILGGGGVLLWVWLRSNRPQIQIPRRRQ